MTDVMRYCIIIHNIVVEVKRSLEEEALRVKRQSYLFTTTTPAAGCSGMI